jgi:hypothetical protein
LFVLGKQEIPMGVQSLLYGYIEEAWPGAAAGGDAILAQQLLDNTAHICRHNEDVLNSLPVEDSWPPLMRQMFGWAPWNAPLIVYWNRPIHFAASLKELDFELQDWLDKFEKLLRMLYWETAVVHFEAAYLGYHTFTWSPKRDWVSKLCKGSLELITEWDFESSMDCSELEQLRGGKTTWPGNRRIL